jgi:outer membrane protein OmpA-like peptidoglycan-associated protein
MPTVSPLAAQEAEVARRRAAEEQEAKKKAEADAAARAKAQADAEAARRANAERDARIKAQADADAKAKADAEAKARAEADAKRKLDEDNRARALAEAETKKRQDLAACQQTIDAAAASGMIRFASGRATLVPESSAILDRVAAAAKSCPTAHLSIEGHTDSTGEPERNIRLSAERAASVADYLAKAGVDPWRLKPQGMGAAKPIASNETAEGRAQNRRIAFVATLMSDGERKAAMDAQARRAAEEKTAVEQLAAALKPCRDGIAASVKSEPILFRPSQSAVTREGAVVLDRVVIALKQSCPSETITVEGHTDATGSADEDKELSEARANSVIRYLSRAGFDAKRLRAVGYGRTKPVAANDTEENRAKNRRIEFAVSR